MRALEQAILETAAAWERDGVAHGERRPIIGAVDETFLPRMRLVFMDLASGDLLREEVAADRIYDPWNGLVKGRLKTLGGAVLYLVSDRAKALIKLAESGLDCLSIPDLFPLSHALAKSYSLTIFSRLRQAQQTLNQARERLAASQASPPGSPQTQQALALVAASEAEVKRWQGVGGAYRNHLANLALIVHPWRLVDSSRQRSPEGAGRLPAATRALDTLRETNGLPVKKNALATVRQHLAGVSSLVDFWWQTGWHDLEQMALTPTWKQWGAELLLPLMYWQEHLLCTRCPDQKAQTARGLQAARRL
jgi:hypothetical protein